MYRRNFLGGAIAFSAVAAIRAWAAANSRGEHLAEAARTQVGVTLSYDPRYTRISYPNGDVRRSTGVCADVVIRAGRDAFGLDLQKLVHEDMQRVFDSYPAHRVWGSREPDSNIDHRRVLNLETYWKRMGCELWAATGSVAGDEFQRAIEIGDIITWRLDARLPHVGIVASTTQQMSVVHNIGNGAEETRLAEFHAHRAAGHFRWPKNISDPSTIQ